MDKEMHISLCCLLKSVCVGSSKPNKLGIMILVFYFMLESEWDEAFFTS